MFKLSKKRRRLLGFDDRLFVLLGIPIVGATVPFIFFDMSFQQGMDAIFSKWIISTSYSTIYWLSMRENFLFWRSRIPEQGKIRQRIIYTALTTASVIFIIDFLCRPINEYFYQVWGLVDNGPPGAEVLIAPITLILIISGIYEGIYLSEQWKASILEKEQLKRENIASQLEGLRSQVNPHFLFNSLNTLAYMIPEDPDQSVKFVQKLSKVYRYILEIRDKQLISIAEEINCLQS